MPQQNPETFNYLSITKKLYVTVVGLLLLSCLIIARVRMVEVMQEETLLAIGKLILACSVPLSILVRLVLIVQPRIFSSYEVSGKDIYRIRGKKRHHFSMDDITTIRLSMASPRFFGGFRVQMKSGITLTFLSALKDSHRILDRIIQHRPELLDAHKVQTYIDQCRRVDVSWKRLKEKALNWKMVTIKYLGMTSMLTILAVSLGYQLNTKYKAVDNFLYLFLLFLLLVLVVGFSGNTIEERWVLKHVNWDETTQQLQRNLPLEKKTAHLIDGLFFVVIAGVGYGLFYFS